MLEKNMVKILVDFGATTLEVFSKKTLEVFWRHQLSANPIWFGFDVTIYILMD
jgi:hypothetical protein